MGQNIFGMGRIDLTLVEWHSFHCNNFFRRIKASMDRSAGTKIDIFSRDGIFERKWEFCLLARKVGDFSSTHSQLVDWFSGLYPAIPQIASFNCLFLFI
jgi:hypothetical protein